tara:strand:+ start:3573 stop:4358 length:786 start_codon:yes stop_codon:yes gene_type:complete
MFGAGFLYSVVGLLLSYFVFKAVSGILMVFLVVIATLPMIYTAIKQEEELDLKHRKEWRILQEHAKFLTFVLFLFMGITTAFVVSYIFLPAQMVNTIFALQNQAIHQVNSNVAGNVTMFGLLKGIIFNNLKVLFFCVAFAFLYGSGAIFILTWNASVIAAAVGSLIKSKLAATASLVGLAGATTYFGITTFSFMRYLTHGMFEIIAYLIAGLAGGIISVAVVRKNLGEEKILFDISGLVMLSIILLMVAGVIEVYVTPAFF